MTVINLYRNESARNVIRKDLSFVRLFSGTFREPFDISSPVLCLRYQFPIDFNYVEIPELGRKYFVKSYRNITEYLWEFYLEVDVLESFKNTILNLEAVIDRNEFSYDPLIIDTLQVFRSGHTIDHYYGEFEFEADFDGDSPRYILNAPFFLVQGGIVNE